ncbi:MAG: UDP-N-acetylmuramoyl-L-alanyl-D-glutamate--2,6-diaminopimelate ligase, partial [Rikenellaceae bacterium]
MEITYLNNAIELTKVVFDSREVVSGSLFVAVKGLATDGHNFIDKAIESGATTIVCETMPTKNIEGIKYIVVEHSDKALAQIASLFYGEPSKKLKLVGVTGTNGKTTTATLLYDLFTRMGHKVGLISTVVYKVIEEQFVASHTTPDSVRLNSLLAMMVEKGCDYCFMEVSSHSICQNRIESLHFAGGIFTNITHDHLDYHGTFAEYIKAKKRFFDELPKNAFAIYNGDDKNGKVMMQNCKASVKSFALTSGADYKCKIIESLMGSMLLRIDTKEVWVKFIGKFNAYNLLGVYAAAMELGADRDTLLLDMSMLTSVAGRFEYVISTNGITAIIDYAHTPDALENVLKTIEEVRTPSQRIITVVGCGGNRDKTKRPEMAQIAAQMSDFTIFTSDNPRNELPEEILSDMTAGLKSSDICYQGKYLVVTDRREAIGAAVAMAHGVSLEKIERGEMGDIILIAGKGHETYQEIKGVRTHFDDKEQINERFSNIK